MEQGLSAESRRIRDLPDSERPRERLARLGADALKTSELIAILLRTGLQGVSAIDVAEQLLKRFGSLAGLCAASIEELRQTKGIGRDKAIALKAAFTLANRMAKEIQVESPIIEKPQLVADLVRDELRLRSEERFVALLLNTRHRLIRVETISTGTLDASLVHPRELFRPAITANAAAIIVVHNHPSGDPTPSSADIQVTREIVKAGALLKIPVLDHVIIGKSSASQLKDYASLQELGLMPVG